MDTLFVGEKITKDRHSRPRIFHSSGWLPVMNTRVASDHYPTKWYAGDGLSLNMMLVLLRVKWSQ
jgi:hypothetical protein